MCEIKGYHTRVFIESKNFEIKERLPQKDQLIKTAVAFSNGGGGEIIIGIKADGKTVTGIDANDYQKMEEIVSSSIFDSIYPPVIPHISLKHINDKPVMSIEINEGTLPPYYLKKEGQARGVYLRVGSSTKRADATIINSLKLKAQNVSFDSTLAPNASINNLNRDICREFIANRKKIRDVPVQDVDARFLQHYCLAGRGHERSRPTVGAVLHFFDNPIEYFPFASIKCARFEGHRNHEYIDEAVISGHLVRQIEETIHFVRRHINKKMVFAETQRIEQYEYPLPAIREIVVNAVCHRDYHARNSDIKVSIYDDRIEVISPGVLPPHITIDDLGKGISEIRNPVIARVLRDWGYIEEWGKGISKVFEQCRKWKLQDPSFSEEGLFFKAVLKKRAFHLSETEEAILDCIEYDRDTEAIEVAKALNLHRNSILKGLKNLLSKGLAIKVGEGRNRKYRRI